MGTGNSQLREQEKEFRDKITEQEKEYREKYENVLKNAKDSAIKERDNLKKELDKSREDHLKDVQLVHKDIVDKMGEMKKENDDKIIKLMQEQHEMNAQILRHMSAGFSNTKPTVKGPRYLMPRNNDGSGPFCLLIDNSTGGEGDSRMKELQSAFKQFGFEVRLENNMQEDDLKNTLVQVAAESDKCSSIIIVLSSPANVVDGHIILSDPTGGEISLKDIWTSLIDKPEDEQKPKLLFLEIESDISKSRLSDQQYPSNMESHQHDFIIAHSLGDGSGSRPFLGMIHELLEQETNKDIYTFLDYERQKECNPRITLKSTLQKKVFLKE